MRKREIVLLKMILCLYMFIMHEFTKIIINKMLSTILQRKTEMVQEGRNFTHFQWFTILTFVLFPSKKWTLLNPVLILSFKSQLFYCSYYIFIPIIFLWCVLYNSTILFSLFFQIKMIIDNDHILLGYTTIITLFHIIS